MKNPCFINEHSKGVFIISTTPFSKNGSKFTLLNIDSLVEFYIDKGISGMTILGMMGEAHKIDTNEAEIFIKHVIKRVN
ncbi:MAG: hypothetical protein CM1200mP16_08030 [Nitrospina sp.]|nr:MAG: hypothetical protein CM1200mP16_08030 [Nitrospina sp.]